MQLPEAAAEPSQATLLVDGAQHEVPHGAGRRKLRLRPMGLVFATFLIISTPILTYFQHFLKHFCLSLAHFGLRFRRFQGSLGQTPTHQSSVHPLWVVREVAIEIQQRLVHPGAPGARFALLAGP